MLIMLKYVRLAIIFFLEKKVEGMVCLKELDSILGAGWQQREIESGVRRWNSRERC